MYVGVLSDKKCYSTDPLKRRQGCWPRLYLILVCFIEEILVFRTSASITAPSFLLSHKYQAEFLVSSKSDGMSYRDRASVYRCTYMRASPH